MENNPSSETSSDETPTTGNLDGKAAAEKEDIDNQITGAFRRRTVYGSAWAGVQRVKRAYTQEKIKLRLNDRITTVVVVLSLCLMIPVLWLRMPLPFFAASVAAIGSAGTMACVFYIINRLGVLEALTGRQAVLVWQLMMVMLVMGLLTASSLISVVFVMNLPPINISAPLDDSPNH